MPPSTAAPTTQQPRASSQPPTSKSVHFDPVSSSSPGPRNLGDSNKRGHPSDDGGPHHNDINEQHSSSSSSSNNNRPSRDSHHRRRASQNDIERSPSPAPSDATIDLPPRFDKYGRPRPERGDDSLADTLEDLFSGKGPAGKLFSKFTDVLGLDDNGSGGGRRRRR